MQVEAFLHKNKRLLCVCFASILYNLYFFHIHQNYLLSLSSSSRFISGTLSHICHFKLAISFFNFLIVINLSSPYLSTSKFLPIIDVKCLSYSSIATGIMVALPFFAVSIIPYGICKTGKFGDKFQVPFGKYICLHLLLTFVPFFLLLMFYLFCHLLLQIKLH